MNQPYMPIIKKNSKELLSLNLQPFIKAISVDVINFAESLDQCDDFWGELDNVLLKSVWKNEAKFELCLLLANQYLLKH